MSIRYSHGIVPAIFALTAILLPAGASSQSAAFTYTDPNNAANTHQYGLLNGDHLALYLNDRGDLGAPYHYDFNGVGVIKPSGQTNGTQPLVNMDGSVPETSGTFAALYSKTSTAGAGSLYNSLTAKTEYITVASALEAYGVYVPGQNAWLHNADFTASPAAFTVSGSLDGMLTAYTKTINAGNGLTVEQTVTIDDVPGNKKQERAQFAVKITNSGSGPLTGLRYARVVNPNQGVYGPSGTVATTQSFGTPTAPGAFAINSTAGGNNLALGVDPGSSGSMGATIFSTSIVQEDALFNSLNSLLGSSNRVTLGIGNQATYTDAANNMISTPDFTADPTFASMVQFDSQSSDDALVLASSAFDLQSGASFNFNFNYYFDPASSVVGNPTPEPGVPALLASICVAGAVFAFRRRGIRLPLGKRVS